MIDSSLANCGFFSTPSNHVPHFLFSGLHFQSRETLTYLVTHGVPRLDLRQYSRVFSHVYDRYFQGFLQHCCPDSSQKDRILLKLIANNGKIHLSQFYYINNCHGICCNFAEFSNKILRLKRHLRDHFFYRKNNCDEWDTSEICTFRPLI